MSHSMVVCDYIVVMSDGEMKKAAATETQASILLGWQQPMLVSSYLPSPIEEPDQVQFRGENTVVVVVSQGRKVSGNEAVRYLLRYSSNTSRLSGGLIKQKVPTRYYYLQDY